MTRAKVPHHDTTIGQDQPQRATLLVPFWTILSHLLLPIG